MDPYAAMPGYEFGYMPPVGMPGSLPPAGSAPETPGYEYGYMPAPSTPFPGAPFTGEPTPYRSSGEAETVEQAVNANLAPFRIEGGKYSPQEKQHAAEHPAGLIRTASVIGKQEQKLIERANWTITVSKELMRFEQGKLGDFVLDWNDFTVYLDEVLRGIGRLRDLLSAGAPEFPTDMTAVQKQAFRPTGDTGQDATIKMAYRAWRESQAKYVGLVLDVAKKGRDIERARQYFWEAQGTLSRTIAEFKRLGKPTFGMDLKVSDLGIAFGILTLNPAAFAAGADRALEARKARQDYDAKMAELAAAVQTADQKVKDEFEALRNGEKAYWDNHAKRRQASMDRERARKLSRENAALVGQSTAVRVDARGRGKILGEVRMPVMVADAWHALASFGPPARKMLSKLRGGRALVDRASFHFARHPTLEEIDQIRRAWNGADAWEPILNKEEVAEWVAVNKLWEEMLAKFNV
jgi:hypothetical protein